MPRKTVYHAEIDYLQILDENGVLDEELARGTLDDADVKALYEHMVICREYDEGAFRLQRSGRMGTFPQNKGQEAMALGAAKALRRGIDYVVPYYRENPALFLHGLTALLLPVFWHTLPVGAKGFPYMSGFWVTPANEVQVGLGLAAVSFLLWFVLTPPLLRLNAAITAALLGSGSAPASVYAGQPQVGVR